MTTKRGDEVDGRPMDHDPTTGRYVTHHDWERDGSIASTIILTVATVSGTEPEHVEPLHEVVNPDALDRLFVHTAGSRDSEVRFAFGGCAITVSANGRIEVALSE